MFSSSRWHPSGLLVRVLIAGGLAILGVVLVWAGLARSSTPDSALAGAPNGHSMPSTSPSEPEPTVEGPPGRADQADVRDRIRGLVLPESDPVAVSIPRIGVRSKLVGLGLEPDGTMEVPREAADAGWFTRGPAPGTLGPAVIAGDVTWNGAGVCRRLGTLRRGDRVSVTRKDGRTAVFAVSRVARFPQSQFPSEEVYGAIDHAGLRLITCAGTYDAAERSYSDNVVVFARLVAVRGTRR